MYDYSDGTAQQQLASDVVERTLFGRSICESDSTWEAPRCLFNRNGIARDP